MPEATAQGNHGTDALEARSSTLSSSPLIYRTFWRP